MGGGEGVDNGIWEQGRTLPTPSEVVLCLFFLYKSILHRGPQKEFLTCKYSHVTPSAEGEYFKSFTSPLLLCIFHHPPPLSFSSRNPDPWWPLAPPTAPFTTYFLYFFVIYLKIEEELMHNVLLVSGVQQNYTLSQDT